FSDTRARFNSGWLRLALMVSVPLVLVGIAAYLYFSAGTSASTDDAYVQADKLAISADISARVVAVAVKDNQWVAKGEVLFRLDDAPFRIALEHAKAQLASAGLQVDGLRATYHQRVADLKAAQDTLAYMQREADRQQQLLATHVTTQAKYDEARHNLDNARQQAAAVEQQLNNVLASLGGHPDLPTDQNPLVMQAQAQVDKAALDLSYAVVRAPADGYVTKLNNLPVGQYLSAGSPAFNLIETDRAWIEANFKETDLTRMRPGQSATCDIDTYPNKTFNARVDSISAGTGSEFSVLPPQNATGNWVKIVQRVPVRMAIENPDPDYPLRAGMSATCSVDTRNLTPWSRPETASRQ
ncbi:MAG: HlyD family secretion protein, partial [Stellaceae bacterium]